MDVDLAVADGGEVCLAIDPGPDSGLEGEVQRVDYATTTRQLVVVSERSDGTEARLEMARPVDPELAPMVATAPTVLVAAVGEDGVTAAWKVPLQLIFEEDGE